MSLQSTFIGNINSQVSDLTQDLLNQEFGRVGDRPATVGSLGKTSIAMPAPAAPAPAPAAGSADQTIIRKKEAGGTILNDEESVTDSLEESGALEDDESKLECREEDAHSAHSESSTHSAHSESSTHSAHSESSTHSVISSTYDRLLGIRTERLRQARTSFNVAISLAVVGILIIFIAIIFIFIINNISIGIISSSAGVIAEIIGAILFKINKDTNDRLDTINKDLLVLERARASSELLNLVSDQNEKDRIIKEMIRVLNSES